MEETNKVGRPRTTIEDLPDNWKEIMMDCGQEGGSAVEIRALLGIGKSAWNTLIEDSEQFRATNSSSKTLCQVWWERNGRRLAVDGGGNASIWIFNMKNRFGWVDKKETEDKGSDELIKTMLELAQRLPK